MSRSEAVKCEEKCRSKDQGLAGAARGEAFKAGYNVISLHYHRSEVGKTVVQNF